MRNISKLTFRNPIPQRNFQTVRRLKRGRTRQFFLQVLVVFVSIAVASNVCAGLGVAHVLHLVAIGFEPNSAKVLPCSYDCRHPRKGVFLQTKQWLRFGEGI